VGLLLCYNLIVVTKRQLGIFLALVSLALVAGALAMDWIGAGKWGGFGPLQTIGLGCGLVLFAVGFILFRLGDRPA